MLCQNRFSAAHKVYDILFIGNSVAVFVLVTTRKYSETPKHRKHKSVHKQPYQEQANPSWLSVLPDALVFYFHDDSI